MATIGDSFLTIADSQSLRDPNGRFVRRVVNLMSTQTPVFRNGRTAPASHGDRHLITRTVGVSDAGTTGPNKGHAFSKSTHSQVWETVGSFSNVVQVDPRTVGPQQSLAQVRMHHADNAVMRLAQRIEREFFYGDLAVDPRGFNGLIAHGYNELPNADNPFSNYVIDGGGASADNTSIWFCTWGDTQTSFIHPTNSTAGIRREDKGERLVYDAEDLPYFAKFEIISKDCGLAVEDYRFNARIANIDVSEAIANPNTIFDLLEEAYFKIQVPWNQNLNDPDKQSNGRTVIYLNRDIARVLSKASRNGGSADNFVRLEPMQLAGQMYEAYRGIPIQVTDALTNTEELVS